MFVVKTIQYIFKYQKYKKKNKRKEVNKITLPIIQNITENSKQQNTKQKQINKKHISKNTPFFHFFLDIALANCHISLSQFSYFSSSFSISIVGVGKGV